jgi:hypothetical protein
MLQFLLLLSVVSAFQQLPGHTLRTGRVSMSANDHSDRMLWLRKTIGCVAISTSIFTSSYVSQPFEQHVELFSPPVAQADFRAAQKRTYFRFTPKLITGRDFYRTELKAAVEREDWAAVSKFFEKYVSKVNKNDPNQVDARDSYVNNNLYRPMKVLAGSFAERGTSDKQKSLLEQEEAFETAMARLEGCVKDMKGDGFFAGTIKMPTGQERSQQGIEAWAQGVAALDAYFSTVNSGLMLELNKLPM